jgi:hypothetical protein
VWSLVGKDRGEPVQKEKKMRSQQEREREREIKSKREWSLWCVVYCIFLANKINNQEATPTPEYLPCLSIKVNTGYYYYYCY